MLSNGGNAGPSITVPTLEEASAYTTVLNPGSVSTNLTQSVFVAPYRCRVEAVRLLANLSIPTNATNYWTASLQRHSAGTAATIATKTTQPPSSGGNGEAVTAYIPWSFDALAFSNDILIPGDVLMVLLTTTGSVPQAWSSPSITFRAIPTSVTP